MLIEILYIPDCPGYAPTVAAVKRLVAEAGVAAEIRSVEVTGQAPVEFRGSPTVRVNGRDIEGSGELSCCGLSCRTYRDGNGLSNVPPDGLIVVAIKSSCY